ncbi:hypothetical protein KFE25_012808 [Diacronema lutheri]|uniref:C2 domain-containing protein n=1 Tax=Diacronema lutheri TaxID=2081491 RepID=A0A8J6C9I8_DIALT|nr:hypothetical protein KFE25_012808 [Diacronema lutheri]
MAQFSNARMGVQRAARFASSAGGSTAVTPSGGRAAGGEHAVAPDWRAPSTAAFDALREENAFLATELLHARRALQGAHAEMAALKLAYEERLSPPVLTLAELKTALERSQQLGAGGAAWRAQTAAGSASSAGAAGAAGGTHHYHGPVHFHFHAESFDGLLSSTAPAHHAAPAPAHTDAHALGAHATGLKATALVVGPISCARLKNRDRKGRSDPFVRVRAASRGAGGAGAAASVETARKDDTLDPAWDETLRLELPVGAERVLVEVWDWDTRSNEALGHVELSLADRPSGRAETFKLVGNAQEVDANSTITLSWEWERKPAGARAPATPAQRRAASIAEPGALRALPSAAHGAHAGAPLVLVVGPISCARLKNRDRKGRSDPFVRVRAASRGAGGAGAAASVETARKDDTLDPAWDETLRLELPVGAERVLVEVWDWDTRSNEALGHVELSLADRPSGRAETFKLVGNAQEVDANSTITLSWRAEPAPRAQPEGRAGRGPHGSLAPAPGLPAPPAPPQQLQQQARQAAHGQAHAQPPSSAPWPQSAPPHAPHGRAAVPREDGGEPWSQPPPPPPY